MAAYFAALAHEIGTNVACEQNGIDQGHHNVLVYSTQVRATHHP